MIANPAQRHDTEHPQSQPNVAVSNIRHDGDGIVYYDPNNAQNNIRIMTGNPNSQNPAQQVDYVKYQKMVFFTMLMVNH